MDSLVIMKNQQAVTTSLQVAEGFAKRHTHVIEAIEKKISSAENSAQYKNMFAEGFYQDSSGKSNKLYYMTKDGFTFIAMGFTGAKADKFKLLYIEQFNQMEQHIKEQRVKLPSDPMEILALTFKAQEQTNGRVEKVEKDVDYLKNNVKLEPGNYNFVSRHVGQKINQVISDRNLNKKAQAPLRKELNTAINTLAGVRTRSQMKDKDFDRVVDFIDRWEPSTLTMDLVRQLELELDQQGIA